MENNKSTLEKEEDSKKIWRMAPTTSVPGKKRESSMGTIARDFFNDKIEPLPDSAATFSIADYTNPKD